jgi:hypothetical protein
MSAAAMRQGRRVVGIEINREWAEVARERVRADVGVVTSFVAQPSRRHRKLGCAPSLQHAPSAMAGEARVCLVQPPLAVH